MMDEINTIRQTTATNTQKLKNKQSFLDSIGSKIEQLSALPEAEKQLAVVVPEKDREQDFIRVLHEYASQSGVTINTVTNNSSTSETQANASRARGDILSVPVGLRKLEFDTSIVGSYEQVRLFMKLIENSPRIIDVKSVIMQQEATQPGQVTSKIVVNLYSQQTSQEEGL